MNKMCEYSMKNIKRVSQKAIFYIKYDGGVQLALYKQIRFISCLTRKLNFRRQGNP